jgi:hypothetical protein
MCIFWATRKQTVQIIDTWIICLVVFFGPKRQKTSCSSIFLYVPFIAPAAGAEDGRAGQARARLVPAPVGFEQREYVLGKK